YQLYRYCGSRKPALGPFGTNSPLSAPDSSARPIRCVMNASTKAVPRSAILNVSPRQNPPAPGVLRIARGVFMTISLLDYYARHAPHLRYPCGQAERTSMCGAKAAPSALFQPHIVLDRLHAAHALCNLDRLGHLGLGVHEAAQ